MSSTVCRRSGSYGDSLLYPCTRRPRSRCACCARAAASPTMPPSMNRNRISLRRHLLTHWPEDHQRRRPKRGSGGPYPPRHGVGPDSLRNGIALCGTVHWMFDRGLISIADYHELLFARGKVPKQVMSLLKPDRRLQVPSRPEKAPHPIFCAGIAKTFSRGDQCLSCLPRHCEAKPKQSMASRRPIAKSP